MHLMLGNNARFEELDGGEVRHIRTTANRAIANSVENRFLRVKSAKRIFFHF